MPGKVRNKPPLPDDGGSVANGSHSPWFFLFATLAWTWACWGSVAVTASGEGLSLALFVLGGIGPVVIASLLVALGRADETLPMFWQRILDPRGLSFRHWSAIFVLAVLPPLALWLAAGLLGHPAPALTTTDYMLIGVLAGLAEEPGWRGYAQEGLQRKMPIPAAGLIVGVFWAAWHLPLFWIAGTWQHGQGLGTSAFWLFLAGVVVLGPIYAWLYNFAGGAILAVVLMHATSNLANEVFALPGLEHLQLAVYAALAALLIAPGRVQK